MSLPNYTEHTRAISANLTPLRNDMPDLMKAFGRCWPLRCLHRLSR